MSEVASIATAEEVACPGGPQLALAEIERLAERMYEETIQRLRDVDLRGVVKHRITALYGPPMASPDLMLVSFQGSGGDSSPSEPTWPERLLYLDRGGGDWVIPDYPRSHCQGEAAASRGGGSSERPK